MITDEIKCEYIYFWLFRICSGIKTDDHKKTAIQLLKIAKKNKHITNSQNYDLYMVLYEKAICGTVTL